MFDAAFKKVIMLEGGYVNNPLDPGGKTKYGITERTARAHGYEGKIRDLTLEWAKQIYKKSYWDTLRLDEINDPHIQFELFDTGVNCGTRRALKFTQQAYNLLVKGSPLVVDGLIGKRTILAINRYKYPNRIVKLANALQAKYYLELAEGNEKFEAFIFGWLDHRVEI